MRTIDRDTVVALIFSKDEKILALRQAEKPRNVYPGLWAIVGGGINDGESHRDALNREVLEETGIDISKYTSELTDIAYGEGEKTLPSGERVLCKMKFNTYKVSIVDKGADELQVVFDDEHTEYEWLKPEELKHKNFNAPSLVLFTKLGLL